MNDSSRLGFVGTRRAVAVAAALACVVLTTASADDPPKPEARVRPMVPDTGWRPKPGDKATIYGEGVMGAVSLLVYQDSDKYRKANDAIGMKPLLDRKTAVPLAAGTEVLVLKSYLPERRESYGPISGDAFDAQLQAAALSPRGTAPIEVRILSGESKDRALFVNSDDVAQLIPGRMPPAPPEPPKPKAKPKPITPEARAKSLMGMAQNSAKNGKADVAAEYYRRIIKEYPDTPEAKVAAERLKARP